MSMSLMADVMHVKVGNPMAKLVLLKLAENAKDDGKCWPSHQHVATYCECSKASVRRHIANLEEMGFLKKETRKGHKSGKGNASNVYYLTLNAADKLESEETVNIPPEMECDDQSSCEDINYCAEVPQPAQPVLTESTPYVQTEHTPPMLTESIPYAHSEHTLCSQRAPEPVREPVSKISCQADEQPDDLAAPAEQVLGYFNQTTDSSYRDGKTTMGYIRGRLAEGYTAEDLMLVVDYLTAKWLKDPKMSDYLRPRTLFSPENCAEYFDKAKKWTKNGRPACINGKWQTGSAPRKDALDFNNTDWIYGIQDTLLSAGVGA